MHTHVRKFLERACWCGGDCSCGGGALRQTPYPGIPCMALRDFGDVSLSTRVADHKKRTDQRDAKHRAFMEEARDRPEDFSPVVPYKGVGDRMVGRKIEVRWWVRDSKTHS